MDTGLETRAMSLVFQNVGGSRTTVHSLAPSPDELARQRLSNAVTPNKQPGSNNVWTPAYEDRQPKVITGVAQDSFRTIGRFLPDNRRAGFGATRKPENYFRTANGQVSHNQERRSIHGLGTTIHQTQFHNPDEYYERYQPEPLNSNYTGRGGDVTFISSS